jgi:hypothetical protein
VTCPSSTLMRQALRSSIASPLTVAVAWLLAMTGFRRGHGNDDSSSGGKRAEPYRAAVPSSVASQPVNLGIAIIAHATKTVTSLGTRKAPITQHVDR